MEPVKFQAGDTTLQLLHDVYTHEAPEALETRYSASIDPSIDEHVEKVLVTNSGAIISAISWDNKEGVDNFLQKLNFSRKRR